MTERLAQFVPAILQSLDSQDNTTESAELIINIFTFKCPNLQDSDAVKIVIAAFLRLGRVVEALALSRKIALAGLQSESDFDADSVEQANQTMADLVYFIFDTCYTCELSIDAQSFDLPPLIRLLPAVPPLSASLDKLLSAPLSQSEDDAMMSWLAQSLASSSRLPDDNIALLTEWATGRLMAQGR